MDTAFSVLESSAQKSAPKEKETSDIYGELVAAKLKEMVEEDRELCMHRINNILFEMKYKNSTPSSLLARGVPYPQSVQFPISFGHPPQSQSPYASSSSSHSSSSRQSEANQMPDYLPQNQPTFNITRAHTQPSNSSPSDGISLMNNYYDTHLRFTE